MEHQVDDQNEELNYNEPLQFFFEFTNRFEDITEDEEVILMDHQVFQLLT